MIREEIERIVPKDNVEKYWSDFYRLDNSTFNHNRFIGR